MGMRVSYNEIFRDQNKNLIPDAFRKAIISNVNVKARTVDIYFVKNPETTITGVPVSSLLTVSTSMIGQRCKVDIFDEVNSKDMVVAYTY